VVKPPALPLLSTVQKQSGIISPRRWIKAVAAIEALEEITAVVTLRHDVTTGGDVRRS